jgi:UDP-4-amino-4,6-dideoxy-N-acetyl-beta-L-altrosamine transaminase
MIFKPIPYGRQHITEEDIQAVAESLRSDYLTQGPKINEFETAFAAYTGARYAVAVNNATAGLHLCALTLGVKPGDKIIVPPITFAATANCIRYCGGEVVFCDIDKETYLMDIHKLKSMLEAAPKGTYKGIVLVDFAGYPVNLEDFKKLADEYGLWVIEDACHAPGGYFIDKEKKKQYCGNGKFADLAVFSFHPVKHIATGEGGMVTTNSKELYDKLCLYRTHGITKDPALLHENHGGWYYEMQELGYNYRMTDFQAALGISQLKRADAGLEKRQAIAQRYNQAFARVENLSIPCVADDVYHAYHLYVIQVKDRSGLYNYLHKNHIYAQVHYIPLHVMPYYQGLGNKEGDLPVAEEYYEHCLSLPMYPTLSEENVECIIKNVLLYVSCNK